MDERENLTAPEAAEMCGVNTKTIHRWVKAGYFPTAYKGLGKTSPYHIPRDEVEAFIERMSNGLKVRWQRKQSQENDREPAALPEDRLNQHEQRAVLAALAELMHRFEGRRMATLFALIIEDDPDAGFLYEFALQAAGFTTVLVESGAQAISTLNSMMPDLILLDLRLPDMPGTDVLQHIHGKERLTEVPVIVATAHPEMAESIQDEATLVLFKPVRYSTLQSKAVELASSD